VSVGQEILVEIRRLREQLPGVHGSLVASLDGLLVAADMGRQDAETLAALAAANLAVGRRVAGTAGYGELTETLVTALGGHVATYSAGPRALLTVLTANTISVGLLHIEARQVAERVAAVIEVLDVGSGDDLLDEEAPAPPRSGPAAPGAHVTGPHEPLVPGTSPRGSTAPGAIRQAEGPVIPMPRRVPRSAGQH
jgi:predicted regulator of Ras-like GTPase activity (Roadblock/LC7/MglB family)